MSNALTTEAVAPIMKVERLKKPFYTNGGERMKVYMKLGQHVGAPCSPVIEVDERVERGQLIAKPTGLGANLHASVAGAVVEITDEAIVIAMDEEQTSEYVHIPETNSYLEAIELAGIVGAGGAGFPTHVKYKEKINGGYVIANAVECEPLLGHNVQLMEEKPELIVRGLKYLLEISGAKKAYIAIKSKYREAVLALVQACKGEPDIEIKIVSDLYPAGDERVIVRELLGVELQPGELPSVANAVVSNAETIKRIVEAIEERKPYIDKDITVAGRVKEAKIFEDQPIGMPVGHYIEQCGGYIHPHGEVVIGGPFTGKAGTSNTPLTKTTGGILVAMPFPQENGRKIGLLVCECGAGEGRLREIAQGMGSEIVSVKKCKRMVEIDGRYRCDLPGVCPGQSETILEMKKAGMETVLMSSCQP